MHVWVSTLNDEKITWKAPAAPHSYKITRDEQTKVYFCPYTISPHIHITCIRCQLHTNRMCKQLSLSLSVSLSVCLMRQSSTWGTCWIWISLCLMRQRSTCDMSCGICIDLCLTLAMANWDLRRLKMVIAAAMSTMENRRAPTNK